jgi:exosome complex exonuclease DIS3/RRP44
MIKCHAILMVAVFFFSGSCFFDMMSALLAGELSVPEYYHYGLAAPLYTHFTSPIRRYADVIVHRVLMAALGLAPLPESFRDRNMMGNVVDNLNVRHRNAQLAGRASVELHTLIFFKEKVVLADARVTKVQANGLIVFVPKFGIEGPIYFDSNASNTEGNETAAFTFDEERQTVANDSGTMQYTVFDPCAVRIYVKEGVGRRRALALELIPRDQLPDAEKMH